jgi:hypothetical protein
VAQEFYAGAASSTTSKHVIPQWGYIDSRVDRKG